jgi:phosphonate transport system substrate-binding protein
MNFLHLLCLVSLHGAPPSPPVTPGPQQKTLHLSFGVYQTDKATEMYKQFTPLLEALQDDVGERLSRPVDIELKIFRTYDDGINALVSGDIDFVHFGPASYCTAKAREEGIRLLAMEYEGNHQKRFKGVIVVAKQSPIQCIEDLKGKSFAFGDPNSTIGRYLVQQVLVENHVYAGDLSRFVYLERHDQVAAAVEHGDFDAGSVKFSTFQKANEGDTLRALKMFDNVTKPVVARKGLDDAVFHAIQESLYKLDDKAVLKTLKVSGFMEASDDDYQMVREGMKQSELFEKAASNRQMGR